MSFASEIEVLGYREHVLLNPDMYIGSVATQVPAAHLVAVAEAGGGEEAGSRAEAGEEAESRAEAGGGGEEAESRAAAEAPYPFVFREETFALNEALAHMFEELLMNMQDHMRRCIQRAQRASEEPPPVLVRALSVELDERGMTLCNGGDGIPVERCPETGVYFPELLFTRERSSSNFSSAAADTRAGKNGTGVKIVVIFARRFELETVDVRARLRYRQVFRDNLAVIEPPEVARVPKSAKPYTRVRFEPDLARFGLAELSPALRGYLARRLMEFTASLNALRDWASFLRGLKITLNGAPLPRLDMARWPRLYPQAWASVAPAAVLAPTWTLQCALLAEPSAAGFQQSMVNGVRTAGGGTHVDYLWEHLFRLVVTAANALVVRRMEALNIVSTAKGSRKARDDDSAAGRRGGAKVSSGAVLIRAVVPVCKREHLQRRLALFLCCDLLKPSYEGQRKERLGRPIDADSVPGWNKEYAGAHEGRFFEWPRAFARWVEARVVPAVAQDLLAPLLVRVEKTVERESVDARHRRLLGVPKLTDAVLAGTARSLECTLVISEGDSAEGAIMEGIGNNQTYGFLSFTGKILNCLHENFAKLMGEKKGPVYSLVAALGLTQYNRARHTREQVAGMLRYGRVDLATDQDVDGIHIYSLAVVVFVAFFPALLEWFPDMLRIRNTPIADAVRRGAAPGAPGSEERPIWFFTLGALATFREAQAARLGDFRFRYFKGLGSSTDHMHRLYAQHVPPVAVRFTGEACARAVEMAFSSKKADERKRFMYGGPALDAAAEEAAWRAALARADAGVAPIDEAVDMSGMTSITVHRLVHEATKVFFQASALRAIPHLVDGWKPVQRKLVAGLRLKYRHVGAGFLERTARAAGHVGETMDYHNGDTSIADALSAMVSPNPYQANNLRVFRAEGQFGKVIRDNEAAAPRYTSVGKLGILDALYPPADDAVLQYLQPENGGRAVEPLYFAPVLPNLLLNGQRGIGSGYNHLGTTFAVADVAAYQRRMLAWLEAGGAAAEAAPPAPSRMSADAATAPLLPRWTAEPAVDGFPGTHEGARVLRADGAASYLVVSRGRYARESPTRVRVTALPMGLLFSRFKKLVMELFERKVLADFCEAFAGGALCWTIDFPSEAALDALLAERTPFDAAAPELARDGVESLLELAKSERLQLNVWTVLKRIQTFHSFEELVYEYSRVRLEVYRKRRAHRLGALDAEVAAWAAKCALWDALHADPAVMAAWLAAAPREQCALLRRLGVPPAAEAEADADADADADALPGPDAGYRALLDLHPHRRFHERGRAKLAQLRAERAAYAERTAFDLWRADIDHLLHVYETEYETNAALALKNTAVEAAAPAAARKRRAEPAALALKNTAAAEAAPPAAAARKRRAEPAAAAARKRRTAD